MYLSGVHADELSLANVLAGPQSPSFVRIEKHDHGDLTTTLQQKPIEFQVIIAERVLSEHIIPSPSLTHGHIPSCHPKRTIR